MSIELRLSDVDPPAPDPPRTIYRDVLNLPDPVKLGITIRYFNYDAVGLYFQITGSAPGYTFGTVNLNGGAVLGSGTNKYENLDEFGSRAKPVAGDFTNGEFDESITLILRAYTDAEYSNLKWTHERTVTVVWIKSDDPAWTVDPQYPEGNSCNFDDGTPQGWAASDETGNKVDYPTLAVVTDYVLSAPYSVKMIQRPSSGSACWTQQARGRLYKSFTTPDKDVIYAILNIRISDASVTGTTGRYQKNIRINRDDVVLVFLGRPYDTVASDYIVDDKWIRVVVPLPKNTALEVRVIHEVYMHSVTAFPVGELYLWLDDFKIISK